MGKKYVKCTTKSPGLVLGKPYEVVGASPTSYVVKIGTATQAYSSSYFTDVPDGDVYQVCTKCDTCVSPGSDICNDCERGDSLHPRLIDDICQTCHNRWSKHDGDTCRIGDGKYKPSYEVVAATTHTTQYSSDDWRAWRNAQPGECACGTNKSACWIHKDL